MASFLGFKTGWGLGGIDCGFGSCKKGIWEIWVLELGIWFRALGNLGFFLKDWVDWALKLVVSVRWAGLGTRVLWILGVLGFFLGFSCRCDRFGRGGLGLGFWESRSWDARF